MLVEALLAVLAAAPEYPQSVTEAAAAIVERLDDSYENDLTRRETREQQYQPVEGADTKPEPGRTIQLPD